MTKLNQVPSSPTPKKTFGNWLQVNVGVIALGITILAAIGGGGLWFLTHQIDDRVDAKFKEKGFDEVTNKVHELDGRMTEISGFLRILTEKELRTQAALPVRDFDENISEVSTTLSVARIVHAKPAPEVVNAIGASLARSEITKSDYWMAAGDLISFRSELQSTLSNARDLPECMASKPKPAEIPPGNNWKTFQIVPAIYDNCHFTLDSERDDQLLNSLMLNGKTPLVAFRHCLISYRGGEVNLTRVWKNTPMDISLINSDTGQVTHEIARMNATAIQFAACQFDFSIKSSPPATGQGVTRMLLAQNSGFSGLPFPVENK